jgi:predicted nucleic acid-binding protein
MIFVDTGAWIALEDVHDKNHVVAAKFREELSAEKERFVTTSYVLDETYTFLLLNIGYEKAVYFHDRATRMEESTLLEIIHITEQLEEEAWRIFERFNRDKMWSFTDCTSKAVMDLSRINVVFTFDDHFEQMGFRRRP